MHELFPPFRFRCVADGVYAGSYPTLRNLRFVQRLGLKTIVCLIPEPPVQDLIDFCTFYNIRLVHKKTNKYKEDSFNVASQTIFQVIELLFDSRNLPVYIHCLDGAQICSGVVMCFRKCLNWKMKAIEKEASRYCPEVGKDMTKYVKHWESSNAFAVPEDEFIPTHFSSMILPEKLDELPCGIRLNIKQAPKAIQLVNTAVANSTTTSKSSKQTSRKKKKENNIIDPVQAKKLPAYVDPPIGKRSKMTIKMEALMLESKKPIRQLTSIIPRQELALPASVETYMDKETELFDPTTW